MAKLLISSDDEREIVDRARNAVSSCFVALALTDDDGELAIGLGDTEIAAAQDLVRQGVLIRFRRRGSAWTPLPANGRVAGSTRSHHSARVRRREPRPARRRRRASTGTSRSGQDPPDPDEPVPVAASPGEGARS